MRVWPGAREYMRDESELRTVGFVFIHGAYKNHHSNNADRAGDIER